MEKPSMLVVSARVLKILAALVWYIGGFILLLKGRSLLAEADALEPEHLWPWLGAGVGLALGGLKAKYLFVKSCRKNMGRIAALEQPKIWQFFRPSFFMLLTLMIMAGATLSRLAHGNYVFLILVAVLDIGIAIALLGSSYVFWDTVMIVTRPSS
jgi:hypothetical protein